MNAVDILKYGHLTLVRTLEGVPDGQWETDGVCGVWSVKDIMAHLTSYEHMLVDVLSGFLSGGDTPPIVRFVRGGDTPTLNRMGELGPQGFNDFEVAARKARSPQEVHAEYSDTQDKTMTIAAHIPPEIWRKVGTLPWYGAEYSLDDYIVYTFYGHKREHAAQIDVFKDRLKPK